MATNKGGYHRKNVSLNAMRQRLGYDPTVASLASSPSLDGYQVYSRTLHANGGPHQQDRMVLDKKRSLDRALVYSYQGCNVKKVDDTTTYRALINPDKNKQDYDDKILSIGYEAQYKAGDVFEWIGTDTYWLVYLQELTEVAYFRSEIRKCQYQIAFKDEDGNIHSTYAAVRGPVETALDYIQKQDISVDQPNYSLNILMPKNEDTLKYFRRYAKFYLSDPLAGAQDTCWRVTAIDWISMEGVLEVNATEYYANKDEDSDDIAGNLIVKPTDPNSKTLPITGETFIKPHITYTYKFTGQRKVTDRWALDKKYPVEMTVNGKEVTLKWNSNYSGQMILSFGAYKKTIVVQSLF